MADLFALKQDRKQANLYYLNAMQFYAQVLSLLVPRLCSLLFNRTQLLYTSMLAFWHLAERLNSQTSTIKVLLKSIPSSLPVYKVIHKCALFGKHYTLMLTDYAFFALGMLNDQEKCESLLRQSVQLFPESSICWHNYGMQFLTCFLLMLFQEYFS